MKAKKVLSICMVTALALSLSACGKETEDTKETTADTKSGEDWVSDLEVADLADQLLIVAAGEGSNAVVSFHEKEEDGSWTEIVSTDGYIGKNGLGKSEEGDGKTPIGTYGFSIGFGIEEDPGCSIPYTQVDDTYYWVDDVDSEYYNQFVSTNDVTQDWNSAEHISEVVPEYNYALAIDYNIECTPGLGSGIFLHCTGNTEYTAGCVAVPEDVLLQIMKDVNADCIIVIDYESEIENY